MLSGEGQVQVPLLQQAEDIILPEGQRQELIYGGRKGAMVDGGKGRAAGAREIRAVWEEGMGRVPLFGEDDEG